MSTSQESESSNTTDGKISYGKTYKKSEKKKSF